jgi:hypothetical protein
LRNSTPWFSGKFIMQLSFQCSSQNSQVIWDIWPSYPEVIFVNASSLNYTTGLTEGGCYFKCALNDTERYQSIHVRSFSVIIDSGQALFNLSAYFSCPFSLTSAYVQIEFYTETLISNGTGPVVISEYISDWHARFFLIFTESEANPLFHFKFHTGTIPRNTRVIYISVGANILFKNVTDRYCLVDNIELNIFEGNR